LIWSLCPYAGEADVLELRLGQLEGVVDRHVLCEGTTTQRGDPKPLLFPQQYERFDRWLPQIEYIGAEMAPRGLMGDWPREALQRQQLELGYRGQLAPSDLVLISDVDEIPDPAWLDPARCADNPVRLEMAMHMYYLNWRWRENPVRSGTRATLCMGAKLLENPDRGPHDFVEAGWRGTSEQAGWHLAYQLSPKGMREKIRGIADSWCWEFAERPLEHFEHCRRTGLDLFDRPYRTCDWVGDEALPPYAVAHRERFAHMFCEQPAEVYAA
jgi:beta-1,4-mannosyl-glycoprotein beta-1,4-N-acetylglucosaminyltransferase